MYKASFANVPKGGEKAATKGFKYKKFSTLRAFARAVLTQASIPVKLSGKGWRSYENVVKICDWMRFDCDAEGEAETVEAALQREGLAYVKVPSTNYHQKHKPYKWHFHVPTKNTAQDVMKYKWQMKEALIALGLDAVLSDTRLTEVCVQNANPYQNGANPRKGRKFATIMEGSSMNLKAAPKELCWKPILKVRQKSKGSTIIIPKKVVKSTENLQILDENSGINVEGVGWIRLADLDLEPGMMVGGLSCPGHNHNHAKGAYYQGYAFATMNEGGDVWIRCTGAQCKGVSYKMEKDDFGASVKISDLYELRRRVAMSAFNFKENAIIFMREDGTIVYAKLDDLVDLWGESVFWKLPPIEQTDQYRSAHEQLKTQVVEKMKDMVSEENTIADTQIEKQVKSEIPTLDIEGEIVKELDEYVYKRYYDGERSIKERYIKSVVSNIVKQLKFGRQYKTIEYDVNLFEKPKGECLWNVFKLTTDRILPPRISGDPDKRIIEDYREHNPFMEDIMEMVMAQRFGADRKTSYLWVHADSDWGKNFFFQGMMGDIAYNMNETELKNSIKGSPSGLDPERMVKSSILLFDEFKGAVSELKNVVESITFSPKHRGKVTVPVYMKVFLSAEVVPSLMSEAGMEEQFRNRFLYIRAKGKLTERDVYLQDIYRYKRNVAIYVNQRMWEIYERYIALGKEAAVRDAQKRYDKLITKYTIKRTAQSLTDGLNDMVEGWKAMILSGSDVGVSKWVQYKHYPIYTDGERIMVSMKEMAKRAFLQEMVPDSMKGMVGHKSPDEIFKFSKDRKKVRLLNKRLNMWALI